MKVGYPNLIMTESIVTTIFKTERTPSRKSSLQTAPFFTLFPTLSGRMALRIHSVRVQKHGEMDPQKMHL